jgi:EAL domain-containing protein (putative c-di-GMP-specific phosphodiesterase class I)
MCVNVSPHQLRRENFVQMLADVVTDTHCDPTWIVVELTQTSLSVDDSTSIEILASLHALGIGIALGDFGTGYASLSYLRRFPLDYVKIDRSFISGTDRVEEDDAIIAAITAMSHTLNLSVVAEGVETESQSARIKALGCDAIEAYLHGRDRQAGS